MPIYDISVPLGPETPVYAGDTPISITPKSSIAAGDSANVSLLSLGSHSGTHIDAPFHFDPQGKSIDRLPPELFVGPAQVVEVGVKEGYVTRRELLQVVKADTTRLLLKTPNSALWREREFEKDFVYLSLEAARWVVEAGIKLVGIDYLSIEQFHSPDHAVHHALLDNGIGVLEGLNLSRVPPGDYHLICLPLKIVGGDGSPARVVLQTI